MNELLDLIGKKTLIYWQQIAEVFRFILTSVLSIKSMFIKKQGVFFWRDFFWQIQQCGPSALPIVSLICFMIGFIVAFVGSIQLRLFGAEIYVASLVAISITRIMGAIMTGIIMSGRTGASYAATIGTMTVNEEVDALKTMGISPFEFLVAPRVFSLTIMMPILTLYSDLIGIIGGGFVGVGFLDISLEQYIQATIKALKMKQIIIGLIHSTVYGFIIAICGCYNGLKCSRNADAVGMATTKAVISAIVWMTVATLILTIFFSKFKV